MISKKNLLTVVFVLVLIEMSIAPPPCLEKDPNCLTLGRRIIRGLVSTPECEADINKCDYLDPKTTTRKPTCDEDINYCGVYK